MCQTILRWSSDWSLPACRTHLRLPAAGIWSCLRQEPGCLPLHQATVVSVFRVSAFALFDQLLGCPQRSLILAMASSSEAAITQPLSDRHVSPAAGVAAIQMATAEVSSCTAQHCRACRPRTSPVVPARYSLVSRAVITLSSCALWRLSQRRVCCRVVLSGEVGRAVSAWPEHAFASACRCLRRCTFYACNCVAHVSAHGRLGVPTRLNTLSPQHVDVSGLASPRPARGVVVSDDPPLVQ